MRIFKHVRKNCILLKEPACYAKNMQIPRFSEVILVLQFRWGSSLLFFSWGFFVFFKWRCDDFRKSTFSAPPLKKNQHYYTLVFKSMNIGSNADGCSSAAASGATGWFCGIETANLESTFCVFESKSTPSFHELIQSNRMEMLSVSAWVPNFNSSDLGFIDRSERKVSGFGVFVNNYRSSISWRTKET